jgi:hypothetical protein
VEYFQIVDQSNVSVAFGENDLGDYPIEVPYPFEGPQLEVIASTPEPAASVLLGLGIVALSGLLAKRRRAARC